MALQQIATHREGAEIYQEAALCKQKSMELLAELRLPKGLIPKLNDLVEIGYNRATGFVWMKRKKSFEYRFKTIGKTSAYEQVVTAFVEDRRMRKVTGVKGKELLIWVRVSDIYIDDRNPGKITFANPTGLSTSFAVTAFEADQEDDNKNM